MKKLIITLASSMMLLSTFNAYADGCLKGAAVGGVGGHFVGSGHAVLGAVGGCIVGRHLANKKAKEDAQRQAQINQQNQQRATH